MKRMRIVGMALVALFAMTAAMTASASASPIFKTCIKAVEKEGTKYKDGEYSNSTCGKAEVGGKFKLGPFSDAKKITLTIKGGKGQNFGWVPLNAKDEPSFPGTKESATECTTEKGKGEFTENGANFKVEYAKCKNGKKECKTEPTPPLKGKPGVIIDNELTGKLVDLPGGKIGLDLTNKAEPETGVLAAYNCEGLQIDAEGSVIGEVQGGQTETDGKLKFNFQAGAEGVQQQWSYPSALISESEGEHDAWQWSLEAIFGGNPSPAAPKPQELLSVINGGEAVIPSQQGSKSEIASEKLKIVG